MKIALAQLDMIWEDKEASLLKAEKMICQAAFLEAELIVFPEMSLTGFSMDVEKIGEDPKKMESVKCMQKFADKYHIGIGFGWAAKPEKEEKKGTNRFTVIDDKGNICGDYSKIHPFRFGGEAEVYQGGNHLSQFPYRDRVISLFVCYDLRFPEIFQKVAASSDLFFVIANWPASRIDQWETLLKARAIENQVYMAGVNCFGERDGIKYNGHSMVVDMWGNTLSSLSGQEGIVYCELTENVFEMRKRFNSLEDRREDLYRIL